MAKKKDDPTLWEKLKKLWRRARRLGVMSHDPELDKDRRVRVMENVSDNVILHDSYVVQISFASVIAALGLLINSSAVVIGAMLISPLFWPIIGTALGIIKLKDKLLLRAALMLSFSIINVLLISAFIVWITPFGEVSDEILARTSPTILDLFIALASAIVGVLALYNPRLGTSAAGVAVSVALLPPLSTAGIGLALGDFSIFFGAFLLFLANMAAIIFVGALVLNVLKFRPTRILEKKRFRVGVLTSLVAIVLISIPLTLYFNNYLSNSTVSFEIENILEEQILGISEEARLNNLVIHVPTLFEKDVVQIDATVFLPQGVMITVDKKNEIIDTISQQTGQPIDMQLNLVDTVILTRREDYEKLETKNQISEYIDTWIGENKEGVILESKVITIEEEKVMITLLLRESDLGDLAYEDKVRLSQYLADEFEIEFDVDVDVIPITRLIAPDQETMIRTTTQSVLDQRLPRISPRILTQNIEVYENDSETGKIEVLIVLLIPESVKFTEAHKFSIQDAINDQLDEHIRLEVRLLKFSELDRNGE